MQINDFEPRKVFEFFSEIAAIPHGSGNTARLAEYCIRFADERGLEAYRDDYGNVMIFKNASAGYETSEPVILQGHLDMVCEKRADCPKDMEREGVDILTDGEYLYADGTTLGGDDGIAAAYILALLDDASAEHPPIEALLTADEETGLRGANALDASRLKGRRLINLDSEEEGVLTVSCAGAARVSCKIPVDEIFADGMDAVKITISGLLGGHSGVDINKNRKNAAKVLGELLYELNCRTRIYITSISAGGRLNVITPLAEAVICVEDAKTARGVIAEFDNALRQERVLYEPNARVLCGEIGTVEKCADVAGTRKIIFSIMQSPFGVRAISEDIPELVQTSSNLGEAVYKNGMLALNFMLRSNSDSDKSAIVKELKSLTEYIDGEFEVGDNYPAWEYRKVSPLRDAMVRIYEDMHGRSPKVCAIHAGLECGILTEKLPGADMVSIGPNMYCVHTPDERLEIKSVMRCWEYLLRILKELK